VCGAIPNSNSSAVYGFVFDFCGIEVDRDTGVIRIDKYVNLHDAGRILNPALFDGPVHGGFAMAIGSAYTSGSSMPRTAVS
jgi:2-furoyl-CoA dehydrogenase large subunit